jgi:S1-C subfamily serine protease
MNDGVDGAPQPGAEPQAAETPAETPLANPTETPAAASAAAPSAYPSGYPAWASAATPVAPVPAAASFPAPPPPSAPQPAAAPWAPQDPWAFAPAGSAPPPPAPPTWAPAWPPGPAPSPRPHASRRTAAVAALLLFAAAAGASAGVVALTTNGSRSVATTQTPVTPAQPGNPGAANPGTGINPGTGSGGAGTSTGPLDQAAIAAKLDPAIVDITVTLSGGSGTAQGTGMIITSNGQVLTNNHVIDGASAIKVQVGGTGSTHNATVVGYDVTDDVALLQMQGNPSGLTTIQTGDPSALNVGDSVLALGNALGKGGTPQPAAGTVTALNQTITAGDPSGQSETLSGLIETNALIQPGDSGGPLVNSSGQVIGVDTAASVAGGRFRRFGATTGQGYAIPIDAAMQIVQQIRSGGGGNSNIQTGQRALLGVGITDSAQGATVTTVQAGSPAESAGIVAGDVITSVGGAQVTSASTLQSAILKHKPGDHVTVTWTDAAGKQHSASATLITGPPA